MRITKFLVALALSFCLTGHSRAQDFKYSNHSALKQAIVEGKRLGPPSSGGSLLDAVEKHFFDVALLELRKPGVIEKNGPDALNFAIRERDHDMIAFLLAAGVSPNTPIDGWYPTGEAALAGDMGTLCNMLNYGVDISKRNERVGNIQMALSKMHITPAIFLMAGGYKVEPDERLHIEYFGKKNGVQGLIEFILNLKPNSQLVNKMCAGNNAGEKQ